MAKRYIIILFFFISISFIVDGQSIINKVFNNNYDSTYYDKLDNFLTSKIFISSKLSEFTINDNNIDKYLYYNSKATSSFGLGLSYKWIGLSLSVRTNNSHNNNSKLFNLQTQFYLRKFTINFYSALYKGYYLDNTIHMINGSITNQYYLRDDITNYTFGIDSYYIFNSGRYSNRATFSQNEWQKKTAGSFLVGGSVLYNKIDADSSIVPSQIKYPKFLDSTMYQTSKYMGIGGSFGYTFAFVVEKHWFFDANILLGLTVANSSISPINASDISALKVGFNLSNRFGIGYNSKTFYGAITFTNLQSNVPLPINNTTYKHNIGVFQVVIVYRFKIPEHDNILPNWIPLKL
jgi:hypothetical protein